MILEPMDVLDAGLVNEPGGLCWTELNTRDPDAATSFHGAVFGWHAHELHFRGADGSEMPYAESLLATEADPAAGMWVLDDSSPDEAPPHWVVYFAVDDSDAAASKASELGGVVAAPPTDIPPGRMAVLSDPKGGYFTILHLSES